VLREIILGGINELPDQNNLSKDILITVDKIEKDGKAEVRFADNMNPIPDEKEREINSGVSLPPDDGFGRAWGLSVVHQVARRGGGYLRVEPSVQGNVITYFIPLAQNA
jgi:sensor histidine kinase regulating citrate/malate metabolism